MMRRCVSELARRRRPDRTVSIVSLLLRRMGFLNRSCILLLGLLLLLVLLSFLHIIILLPCISCGSIGVIDR